MNIKVLIGTASAAALLGIGVLAGSVVGAGKAAAQAPTVTPPASGTNPAPAAPPKSGPPFGMPGDRGGHMGPGGFGGMHGGGGMAGPGGFDKGMLGGGATADRASAEITNSTNLINLVKSDLAYANGKMDTTDVQRWINGTDSLLKNAQSASSGSRYEQAVGYANAARELAMIADIQMAQKLGADKLPSYSQRPQRPNKQAAPSTTVTQAQASRLLAGTYNRLVMQATLVKNATNAGDAATYLTDAQNAYKAAYSAYQAGKYSDAVTSAKLAEQLGSVADAVVRAASAPANSDTPVTVPAPNFQ